MTRKHKAKDDSQTLLLKGRVKMFSTKDKGGFLNIKSEEDTVYSPKYATIGILSGVIKIELPGK